MTDPLHVSLFDQPVGELSIQGPVRAPEDWRFTYNPQYVHRARAVGLSVSMPVRDAPYEGSVTRNWFCNLLPEGAVREAIALRLRIPPRDDFALLASIGGECAGAVSITSPDARPATTPDAELKLADLLPPPDEAMSEGEWALLGTPRRLSLAGAQDKIAVLRADDGVIRLPAVGEITTHIFKPESTRLRGLRDLEALGLALARVIGLSAVEASIIEISGHKGLLIERYDRVMRDGSFARLHQEDFCQALGYPGELKYEAGGGPSLAQCANLVRQRLRLGPVAVQALLDWVIYNAVIGNADAHAKNLALLCNPDGHRSLAPFYDLVPTIAFSRRLVDRTPALRIGDCAHMEQITSAHWRALAAATGYAPGFVLGRLAEISEAVACKLDEVASALIAQGADATRIDKVLPLLRARTQHMRTP
ncbi:MAG: type II toxin-antitoxin system HipA family toxin [Rhodanobacteraceae bacterium]